MQWTRGITDPRACEEGHGALGNASSAATVGLHKTAYMNRSRVDAVVSRMSDVGRRVRFYSHDTMRLGHMRGSCCSRRCSSARRCGPPWLLIAGTREIALAALEAFARSPHGTP